MSRDAIVAAAQESIQRGSKSFRAASRLFDPVTRERAWLLYAWCRHCDDVADGQVSGFGIGQHAPGNVAGLREQTERAVAGLPVEGTAFEGLKLLLSECPIPSRFLDDHLQGFELDAAGWQPDSEADLITYCYHVAGAVGCMMAVLMGVDPDDQPTLRSAADLGIAFQLSNIARDVREDWAAGRCYLPRQWLEQAGVTQESLFDPDNVTALTAFVGRLVDEVERREERARAGVARLPFRSRLAVLAALRIYGAIGRRVRALGASAWDQRVTVGKGRKLAFVVPSVAEALVRR
ncbi:phytoene/squalene synthase family protein [Sphingomonas sabuli]|uniref:Phytoene/squalene synthase family protein n=1 Tax=Sphingomonas sabuli TaxID=2764186 RepID=A0A7G9KZT3_9SPHN|nr:phytoene/squalene synthase family protein [Sphingomonas sabuli]QNM81882.1 phytoene/squalene synthase family protein [Sphingomonas sabuli]